MTKPKPATAMAVEIERTEEPKRCTVTYSPGDWDRVLAEVSRRNVSSGYTSTTYADVLRELVQAHLPEHVS